MVACAAASDVPELTPAQKVATDFHAAAHAAATTVALGVGFHVGHVKNTRRNTEPW